MKPYQYKPYQYKPQCLKLKNKIKLHLRWWEVNLPGEIIWNQHLLWESGRHFQREKEILR